MNPNNLSFAHRGAILLTLSAFAQPVFGSIVTNPTITNSATEFPGFPASNLFDSTGNEYATSGGGAGPSLSTTSGTWVELDFGSTVSTDRMVLISRANTADVVGESRLIFSTDSTFDPGDTTYTFTVTGSNGQGPIQSYAPTSARYVRWEAATSTGSSQNLGGMEMRFLNTPAGAFIAPVSVIGGAAPFSGDYALTNAANGDAGRNVFNNPGVEYASAGLGAATFVDFDFGFTQSIVGFDFFDRINDQLTSFDLLLSDDPTFTTGVTTLSYTPGSDWGFSDTFAEIDARYARFDVTATSAANAGIQDIIFYAVPEPSSGLLISSVLIGGLLVRRRPKAHH